MANPRIDDLRKRLEKEPGSRLFAQLAEELRKDGDLAEAIRVAREGLDKQPNYPSARMTLGRALQDSGDLAAARREFEVVLASAPDNILASRLLAQCLEGLGNLEAALTRYKTTLALSPGDSQVVGRIQALGERLGAVVGRSERATPALAPALPAAAPAAVAAAVPALAAEPYAIPAMETPSGPAELAPEEPAGAEGAKAMEPPPIPLVAADEEFELERPYEAPSSPWRPSLEIPAAEEEAAEISPLEPEFELEEPYEAPGATWQPPAEAGAPAADADLASPTLAELYFNQGLTENAIDVYRRVVEREPANERVRARLMELEAIDRHLKAEEARETARSGGGGPDPRGRRRKALERTIARLEGWRTAIRGMRP